MTKIKQKPLHIFAEIKRVNEEDRTVEAYAFVNEVVEGEGGLRLKRTAMEAATSDYMDWANVRRMHTADAVGTAESVVWDATGAAMVVKVVDDDAWNKVKNRVYKGLSVGVAATVMRGKDVEQCRWYETSLVDRPKDPDAKILAFRAEGVDSSEQEFEAEVEEPLQRSFNDYLEDIAEMDLRQDLYQAWSVFMDCCYNCRDDAAMMSQNLDEFAAYCKTVIGGETSRGLLDAAIMRLKQPEADLAAIVVRLETEQTTVLERAERAETELVRVQAALVERSTALAAAEERVTTLERMPSQTNKALRYPQALERTFTANQVDGVDPERVTALREKLANLNKELPKEPDQQKRQAGVTEYMAVERELQELGVSA